MENADDGSGHYISVMSINLRFGLADDGENSWDNRKKAYPGFFRKYLPDFIGVQEANNFQSAYLEDLLEDYRYVGKREPSPEFWQNNQIFFSKKWKSSESRHYFLSETPGTESMLPKSKWPRQCVIGLFTNGEKRIIHVNTHFDFDPTVQMRSAQLINEFLEEFPKDCPVLLTGDFNAPPYSFAYQVFLKNRFRDFFEGNHSSTFHGFSGEAAGEHIDWILYRGNLRLKHSLVIREKFSGFYPSDHYPVIALFSV